MSAEFQPGMWQAFFSLGGVAGALSLIWQVSDALRDRYRRPKLRILDIDRNRNIFSFNYGPQDDVRFVTVHIKNVGRKFARGCVAQARIKRSEAKEGMQEVALHWADTPVIYRTTGQAHVDVPPGGQWRLDVAFARPQHQCAYLATESALYGNFVDDAALLPGQHEVEIRATFDDGDDVIRTLRILCTKRWEELDAGFIDEADRH